MYLSQLIDKELVLYMKVAQQNELFINIANLLEEKQIVRSSYKNALLDREKLYPTGLDMVSLGKNLPNVAIPHADVIHNLVEKIVVVKLEKPVLFHNMLLPDQEVEVSLIFFIINHNEGNQSHILAQLMDFFTEEDNLKILSQTNNRDELYHELMKRITRREIK